MKTKAATQEALARWLQPARMAAAIVIFSTVVATFFSIAFAWAIGAALGALIEGRPAGSLILIGAIAVVVRAVALWGADVVGARAGRAMVSAARREILDAVGRFGAAFVAGDSAGARSSQIIDRTARLSGWAQAWTPGSQLAVLSPLLVLVAITSQSWFCAALLVVSVLVLPVFIWLTASATTAGARTQQSALDALSGAFQARAAQSGTIRAFRAIDRETAVLRAAAEDLARRTMEVLRLAFLSTAVLEFFSAVSIALLAVYIGFKLLGVFPFSTGEDLTLQKGVMILVLAPEFFAPIRRLSTLHHDRADAVSAAGMLSEWLARGVEPPRRSAPLLHAPVIAFEGVEVAHANGAPAAAVVSFKASPGELIAIGGPSGSGKTACLLALLGLTRVSAGQITIDGRVLAGDESLAESVAFVRQLPWITEGSVADNLIQARAGATHAEMEAVLEQVGALDLVAARHGGLSRSLSRFGGGLSGGERQRLALARAILRGAPIFLLDEPTAHLDETAERDLLLLLRALARDRTILMATHRPAALAAADRVVLLQPAPAPGAPP